MFKVSFIFSAFYKSYWVIFEALSKLLTHIYLSQSGTIKCRLLFLGINFHTDRSVCPTFASHIFASIFPPNLSVFNTAVAEMFMLEVTQFKFLIENQKLPTLTNHILLS